MDGPIQLVGIATLLLSVLIGGTTMKRKFPFQLALLGVLTFVAGTFLP